MMEALKLLLGMLLVGACLGLVFWLISTPTTHAEWMSHCTGPKGYSKAECEDQWSRSIEGGAKK